MFVSDNDFQKCFKQESIWVLLNLVMKSWTTIMNTWLGCKLMRNQHKHHLAQQHKRKKFHIQKREMRQRFQSRNKSIISRMNIANIADKIYKNSPISPYQNLKYDMFQCDEHMTVYDKLNLLKTTNAIQTWESPLSPSQAKLNKFFNKNCPKLWTIL